MDEIVRIERVGAHGDGVAGAGPDARYVPLTLPGERVRAGPAEGRHSTAREILAASPERTKPFCRHFGTCGGCSLQHWREEPYRDWKRNLVAEAFARRGIEAEVAPLVDAQGAGRRRATFHARREGGRAEAGFMGARSHRIVPIERCPVLTQGLAGAPRIAAALADIVAGSGKADILFTDTDTGIDCAVRGSADPPPAARARLAALAARWELARLTLNGEPVAELRAPTLRMGKADLTPPPGAFLQATAEGEVYLWREARARLGKAKRVADLFCGVGPFALRLAELAGVHAFDSDGAAVAALDAAARRTQGLKPVRAERRDLFRRPLRARELEGFDAVVFDPPRQGAEAQVRELARSSVRTIVAVSCDPVTLARDAGILIGGGYRMGPVTPVDQFKWTPHVECIAGFEQT